MAKFYLFFDGLLLEYYRVSSKEIIIKSDMRNKIILINKNFNCPKKANAEKKRK